MGAANPDNQAAAKDHMVQLDGLRAIAVLAVVLHHTLPPAVTRWVDLGGYGVQLFFVLSGFLITGILLKARSNAANAGVSIVTVLRAFYARRFLRIFPLYYAVLIAAYGMNAQGIRQGFFWYLSYLSNYFFAAQVAAVGSQAFYGAGTHLWSLAVEEQFYLFWPILILFLPRRGLPWMLGVTILVGPLSRLALALATGNKEVPTRIPTPSCLDSLGFGGSLALIAQMGDASAGLRRRLPRVALGAGLAMLVAYYGMQALGTGKGTRLVLGSTASALVFGWVVDRAAVGFPGVGRWVLESRPFVYIGTVSYGMYVYQNFVIWGWFRPDQGWTPGAKEFVMVLAATFAVAALSWHLFEKPLNNLKRFFPYVPRAPGAPPATPNGTKLVASERHKEMCH
jgi:peptidoglycan/LPS O-acetylase OafA/YrhL